MHNVKKAGSVSRKHFSLYNLIGKLNDARCKTSAVLAVYICKHSNLCSNTFSKCKSLRQQCRKGI